MAIPTSCTNETGRITIDEAACNGCGLCVEVCSDLGLIMENGKARVSGKPVFGCIGCGHCMAICPTGAIRVNGRTLSPEDLFDLPDRRTSSGYDPLFALLARRRSIRKFSNDPVEKELLQKILNAARTAPMGLPPSDVNVLVLDTRETGRRFSEDFCAYLEKMKWLVSGWFLALMRPFWGKATDQLLRQFAVPLFRVYTENMKKGINLVTYDAPAALYFYGTPYCDPADPIIAATYAMIAAESLGLGTCMVGAIHPLIQTGGAARKFREKHGIRCKSREGIFVIMGRPAVRYQKGIRRTFASVQPG